MENKITRQRLRSRQDFARVQCYGQSFKISEWLLLSFLKKEGGLLRVGWTIPRYVGTAVMRNKLRRWLREGMRTSLSQGQRLGVDVNFVFLNRGPAFYKGLSHEKVNQSIFRAIKKFETMGSCRA